jgi:hypothetical protein
MAYGAFRENDEWVAAHRGGERCPMCGGYRWQACQDGYRWGCDDCGHQLDEDGDSKKIGIIRPANAEFEVWDEMLLKCRRPSVHDDYELSVGMKVIFRDCPYELLFRVSSAEYIFWPRLELTDKKWSLRRALEVMGLNTFIVEQEIEEAWAVDAAYELATHYPHIELNWPGPEEQYLSIDEWLIGNRVKKMTI